MLYGNVRNVFYAGYLRNIDHKRLSRAVSSVYSHVLSPSSVILCLTFIPVLAYIDLSFMWE